MVLRFADNISYPALLSSAFRAFFCERGNNQRCKTRFGLYTVWNRKCHSTSTPA
jgi:hypothetical protein